MYYQAHAILNNYYYYYQYTFTNNFIILCKIYIGIYFLTKNTLFLTIIINYMVPTYNIYITVGNLSNIL